MKERYNVTWLRKKLTPRRVRIGRIESLLPGANCGACGLDSCRNYAMLLHEEGGPADRCPVCDRAMLEALDRYMGRTG